MTDGAEHMGRLEEFLGGNTSDVQAGAAQRAVFDQPDVEPDPCAVQRRGVAAGATADHDDVVVCVRRTHLLGRGPILSAIRR